MNLVFTQSSGFVYSRYAEQTIPFMQEYASKVGADFLHDSQEKKSKFPLFGKFKVGELLETYDRVLFLDCDILVRPDSPDLFAQVPESCFAALNEGSYCDEGEIEARRILVQKAIEAFGYHGLSFDYKRQYFNGGVFLCSKIHRPIFEYPAEHKFMLEVTAEQNIMNLRLAAMGFKTWELSIHYNAMPWRWTENYLKENYFIHYAGMKSSERASRIEADSITLRNKKCSL